jgi:hypothetical protein
MKAKKIFCLVFLVLAITKISAQEKMHFIKLENGSALHTDFYINEVQDNRQIQENIGIAQKGMMNKQVPANFKEDFSLHLQNYFNSILPPAQEKQALTIKFHKLYISERTSATSELGTCEVMLEFLRNENDNLISLGTFQSSVEGKGMDVTPKHDERIKDAIDICVAKFSATNWKNATIAETNETPPSKQQFNPKMLLNKGLYYDFEDIVNNAPKQDLQYRIKTLANNKKVTHFQVLQPDKNKRIKNLFGYSDGQHIYLKSSRYTQSDYFIKSKMIGRYIYFEDQYSSPEAAAAFGLIGAAASTRHTGIVLDTKTGIVTVLNNKNMENLLKDYPELLNEYKLGKRKIEDDQNMIARINKLEELI